METNLDSLRNIGLQFFAEPGDRAPENTPTPSEGEEGGGEPTPTVEELVAALKKTQDDLKRQKDATDNATKEAASYKKQLRASKSEEERRAEEEKERQAAIEEELKTLRRQSALGGISKRVLTLVGDEKTADSIAEYLYGAEDVDAAINAIGKAWADREKKLRLEFSKIPPPAGGSSEGDKPRKDVEIGLKFGREKAESMKRSSEGLKRFM